MIRTERPQPPPAILVSRGRAKGRTLERAYTRSSFAYQSGSKCFAFDSGVYSHASVKEALIAAQYGKCCFCESKITHISYGDIEHFRPKAGYCQTLKGTLERPGYYWLAYEWENLLLCCQLCNQRHKRNYFPLANPRARAICHRDSVRNERPIFINPADEDPEKHTSFRKEVPFAVNGNRRGRKTIQALGLDRPFLNEMRWDEYSQLELFTRLPKSQSDTVPTGSGNPLPVTRVEYLRLRLEALLNTQGWRGRRWRLDSVCRCQELQDLRAARTGWIRLCRSWPLEFSANPVESAPVAAGC
jgi:uncharacterized protein (TIGR02646 family)